MDRAIRRQRYVGKSVLWSQATTTTWRSKASCCPWTARCVDSAPTSATRCLR